MFYKDHSGCCVENRQEKRKGRNQGVQQHMAEGRWPGPG